MNWIAELYDLYEKNKSQAGRQMEEGTILLPLYHTTVAAQVTVALDGEGNFLGAETVPEAAMTMPTPVFVNPAERRKTLAKPIMVAKPIQKKQWIRA